MERYSLPQAIFIILLSTVFGIFAITWGIKVIKSKEGNIYNNVSPRPIFKVKGDMALFYGVLLILIGLLFILGPFLTPLIEYMNRNF